MTIRLRPHPLYPGQCPALVRPLTFGALALRPCRRPVEPGTDRCSLHRTERTHTMSRGMVDRPKNLPSPQTHREERCGWCSGTGYINDGHARCPHCGTSGTVWVKRGEHQERKPR